MPIESLSIANIAIVLVAGFAAAAVGGGIGGVVLAGKSIGKELAVVVGSFYGALAGTAGVVLGLIVLAIIS